MEIHYKIDSMEESGFRYSPDYDYDSIDANAINYQFAHNLVPIPDKRLIAVTMTVEITPSNSNDILATEQIYATFKIEPFDSAIIITDNGFRTAFPNLIETFVNVVIGALRGMLIKNLKGTPLSKSVMPLIPMDVIRNNISKKIEQQ